MISVENTNRVLLSMNGVLKKQVKSCRNLIETIFGIIRCSFTHGIIQGSYSIVFINVWV